MGLNDDAFERAAREYFVIECAKRSLDWTWEEANDAAREHCRAAVARIFKAFAG